MRRILLLVCLLLFLGILVFFARKREIAPPQAPAKREAIAPTEGIPLRTSTTKTTKDFWLSGAIVSIDREDNAGLHAQFVFTGDPFRTHIPVLLFKHTDGYVLQTGTQAKLVDRSTLEAAITKAPLLEVHVGFLTGSVNREDQKLMDAIAAAGKKDWLHLPTAEIRSDFVEVSS